jgi:AcrR family transcriptional regulator
MRRAKIIKRPKNTERWARRYRQALDAAAVTFAERGYQGASTADIARRLGVRQASVYYYFPSKEAALAAVCELGIGNMIVGLRKIVDRDVSVIERIHAAIANHLGTLRTHPNAEYACVFVRHHRELGKVSCRKVTTLVREYRQLLERLLMYRIETDERPCNFNSERAAAMLLALCNSLVTAREMAETATIDDWIEDYAHIFTYGILLARHAQAKR